MLENTNIRMIRAGVYARVEYNTPIEIEVLAQATEEEIQQELDEAARLVVAENCQINQGLQPEITITRIDEEEEGEREAESGFVYRYHVEVSTHQMLHQTVEILSEYPLSDTQVTERVIENAKIGAWTQGVIDQSIDIDTMSKSG